MILKFIELKLRWSLILYLGTSSGKKIMFKDERNLVLWHKQIKNHNFLRYYSEIDRRLQLHAEIAAIRDIFQIFLSILLYTKPHLQSAVGLGIVGTVTKVSQNRISNAFWPRISTYLLYLNSLHNLKLKSSCRILFLRAFSNPVR